MARLRLGGPALVALSGGVDSGVVASLAHEALGPRALAVSVSGTAVAAQELEQARAVAVAVGIEHVVLPADPLASEGYRANGPQRCYHCRSVEAGALAVAGRRRGVVQYLDGVQLDDLGDDRPGIRALDEAGFLHPLLWARWDKSFVRAEARRRGLPNWDRPSNACLASRVARGETISGELLERIETAERVLLERGFRRVRVRVASGAARIEVDPEEVDRLVEPSMTHEVSRRILALGFRAVTVDRRGYRSSSRELPVVR